MKVAYCSLLLPEEKKLSERSKERLSGISNHKVTVATIEGIDKNLGYPVDIFNIINTVNYPRFPQLIFKTEKWNHSKLIQHIDYHLGYINLFGIKYVSQYLKMLNKLKEWIKQLGEEDGLICVHNIYLPTMMAVVKLRNKYNKKIRICLNTGDVPGAYGLQSQYKRNLKQYLTEKIVNKNILKLAKEFDCFVFVTGEMAKAFGVSNKPFTVVECAYTQPPYDGSIGNRIVTEKKIIFYAGAIREEYGITHLLKAFSKIDNPDYRLQIAGGGSADSIVKEYAEKDSRVEFLGFITPQEVLRRQLSATVLVSPRQSKHEYVKYSFPSKSVDSLASGVPYVAHRLPCDPPEYSDYINYTEDESDDGLCKKLIEICEKSEEERVEIGQKAKNFILTRKNPVVMTENIVSMWKNILEN